MQRAAISKASRVRGDRVVSWYCDKASGVRARPELERLREDVRGGRVRKVYVYRLDRFSRGGIVETVSLVKELKACGCELVTLADGFLLEGDAAEVIIAVLSWAAQMERNAINERIAAARENCDAWGRPKRVDDLNVARIRKMHTDGRSLRDIAVALKVPKSTVSNVVSKKGVYARPISNAVKIGVKNLAAGSSK